MSDTEKKQRERLQGIINGNIPKMDISIRYEKSEAQKAEERRDIKAFEIAKAICEASSTFGEALYITEKAANIIKLQRDRQKPSAGEYPVDRFGKRVETPDAGASNIEKERSNHDKTE